MAQVSPNGKLLAYEQGAAFVGWQLMIYNVDTGKRWTRLTLYPTGKTSSEKSRRSPGLLVSLRRTARGELPELRQELRAGR
jgi:hypothetical protein